jgi:hypothetical protein
MRKNFYRLEEGEKRVQAKRGINFFMQFFPAIPPETLEQMSVEDLNKVVSFLSGQKERFERELKARNEITESYLQMRKSED